MWQPNLSLRSPVYPVRQGAGKSRALVKLQWSVILNPCYQVTEGTETFYKLLCFPACFTRSVHKLKAYRREQGRRTFTASSRKRVHCRGLQLKLSKERALAVSRAGWVPGLSLGSLAVCCADEELVAALLKAASLRGLTHHHASPAEKNYLLHSWGAELCLCTGDGGSHQHAAVG